MACCCLQYYTSQNKQPRLSALVMKKAALKQKLKMCLRCNLMQFFFNLCTGLGMVETFFIFYFFTFASIAWGSFKPAVSKCDTLKLHVLKGVAVLSAEPTEITRFSLRHKERNVATNPIQYCILEFIVDVTCTVRIQTIQY